MPQPGKNVTCPGCAHEFSVEPDADLANLVCPHCEARIPERVVRDLSEAAEDLALGFKPGQQIGSYIIEALLGSGGMAVVFRGRQLSLNRTVAIKILPKDLAKNKLFIQRFEREATVLANLNHPNIVSVIDRGCEGETYFIVMEYVEGETLKDRLRREGKLAPDQVLQISEQVLAGLAYAHRHGVVHRDIKPGNIMINREEKVKIADFGLAHLAKTQGGLEVTRDHHTMGTLKYMAPEQLTSAKNVDERTDIYSFGVCLYELITGNLPLGVFKMPTEADSKLDVRWDDIIQHSLREDPNNRFAGADEMARALRELATTPPITQAQREKEEDTSAKLRGVISLTTCASCGHESPPEARHCEKCRASLEDIFDECPSCKVENRLDAAQCGGCGADLSQHRNKLRKAAQAIQAKARQFVSDHQFDSALLELKKLERFHTREYAAMKESAGTWIERLSQRRERIFRRTYEAGQRMVAEGHIERALEFWSALPDDYEDIVARRKALVARADAAAVAVAAGDGFYAQGDLPRAVAEWDKAAALRPSDIELKNRLAAARDQMGNLNLKRTYLREASEEAERGNFDEALVLCRKALDLDPADASALRVAQDIENKGRESAESAVRGLAAGEARETPKVVILPKVKAPLSERLYLRPILAAVAFLGIIALALWLLFIYIPGVHAETAKEAEQLFSQAEALKAAGKPSDAIALCSRIAKDYPDYADKANDFSAEMQKLDDDAHARCREAEAATVKGDMDSLIAGFKKYQEILSGPPVTLVADLKESAARRLEEIRNSIALAEAELGARDEKNGDWRAALERYRMVAEQFGFHRDPITSKIARAQKRLDDCALQTQAGQEAVRSSNWDAAYHAAVAALDLVPTDPDARRLLTSIAPKLEPPPGMVLVPPGKYIVGGSPGNPRRTVELPFGLFIAVNEVTCGRYAEFLHATGRPTPPGWMEAEGNEEMPVANVTWPEASAFAAWAGCGLPTEEQWECACRGPSGQLYPWGDIWAPDNAVLGFGPAPVGSAKGDRSPCGCVDMAGNIAEWTATPLESSKTGPRLYIVKGSSWAGMEEQRPTRVVAVPLQNGGVNAPMLLAADSKTPEWFVRYRSNLEMEYLGLVGTEDSAYVLVRKWVPAWDHWAEFKFQVMPDQEIGSATAVTLEENPKPRAMQPPRLRGEEAVAPPRRKVTLDFTTGCIAVQQAAKEWLDVRDPAGVIRRLTLAGGAAARAAKLNECKDAPPAPEMTLERAVSAPTRMAGRENGRYINVGFRCAKTLWPLPVPPEKAPKAPAK